MHKTLKVQKVIHSSTRGEGNGINQKINLEAFFNVNKERKKKKGKIQIKEKLK